MEWWQKLDELNSKGYDVRDRLFFPDGTPCGEAYPDWWTPEQMVNKAYDFVSLLEESAPNLTWSKA